MNKKAKKKKMQAPEPMKIMDIARLQWQLENDNMMRVAKNKEEEKRLDGLYFNMQGNMQQYDDQWME